MNAYAGSSPRRLKGHKAEATCCISSHQRPGVVLTSAEDGCVCLFDMRCKEVQSVMKLGNDAISSICFKQGNENMIYLSTGTEVRCFDIHMASEEKPLESYNYNKEEINQISCNSKASFLAAADDSGDIKIIDIQQRCPFKTLRSGHASICSCVQFLPWKPWEVITGGLDSKIIMWDYSKGRPFLIVDFGNLEDGKSTGQYYNPAFIHAIAVPEVDMLDKMGKACAVARGDGIVSLLNLESELAALKSKGAAKPRKSSETNSKSCLQGEDVETLNKDERQRLHLDYALGGHTAAASCVTFSSFGERGKFMISGGNDKSVKVWDWARCLDDAQTSEVQYVASSINLQKKVNWLCTTPSDSENLVVCDTSKVVKVYTIS